MVVNIYFTSEGLPFANIRHRYIRRKVTSRVGLITVLSAPVRPTPGHLIITPSGAASFVQGRETHRI